MFRIVVSMILVLSLQMSVACTSDKQAAETQDQKAADAEKRMPRRKIDRLDSKAFIDLSIDLMLEQAEWHKEWTHFMQEKRKEFFESFGLTEKQFTEFAERNSAEFQRFLRDNPQYSQKYVEAMHPREGP